MYTYLCKHNIFQRNYIPINALNEILLSICIKFSFYRFLKICTIFEKIPLIFCFLTTFFSWRLLKIHFTIFNTNDINGWNFWEKKNRYVLLYSSLFLKLLNLIMISDWQWTFCDLNCFCLLIWIYVYWWLPVNLFITNCLFVNNK